MKILVTGATGFLGKHLVKHLTDNTSYEVFTTSTSPQNISGIPHYQCDISIIQQVRYLFSQVQPDCIVHLAARSAGKPDNERPTDVTNINVVGTHNLLHFAPKGCRFLLASSIVVYGDWAYSTYDNSYQYTEEDHTFPDSTYGASKLAAENLLWIYTNMSKVDGISLRFPAIVGNYRSLSHGVIKDVVRKLKLKDKTLQLIGQKPGSKKPYLFVDDAIRAILLFLEKIDGRGRINIVNDEITIEEVAKTVMWAMDIEKPIKWGITTWATDNQLLRCSNELARQYGWEPKYSSKEAIIQALQER